MRITLRIATGLAFLTTVAPARAKFDLEEPEICIGAPVEVVTGKLEAHPGIAGVTKQIEELCGGAVNEHGKRVAPWRCLSQHYALKETELVWLDVTYERAPRSGRWLLHAIEICTIDGGCSPMPLARCPR